MDSNHISIVETAPPQCVPVVLSFGHTAVTSVESVSSAWTKELPSDSSEFHLHSMERGQSITGESSSIHSESMSLRDSQVADSSVSAQIQELQTTAIIMLECALRSSAHRDPVCESDQSVRSQLDIADSIIFVSDGQPGPAAVSPVRNSQSSVAQQDTSSDHRVGVDFLDAGVAALSSCVVSFPTSITEQAVCGGISERSPQTVSSLSVTDGKVVTSISTIFLEEQQPAPPVSSHVSSRSVVPASSSKQSSVVAAAASTQGSSVSSRLLAHQLECFKQSGFRVEADESANEQCNKVFRARPPPQPPPSTGRSPSRAAAAA
jgi:hypothetical protein